MFMISHVPSCVNDNEKNTCETIKRTFMTFAVKNNPIHEYFYDS